MTKISLAVGRQAPPTRPERLLVNFSLRGELQLHQTSKKINNTQLAACCFHLCDLSPEKQSSLFPKIGDKASGEADLRLYSHTEVVDNFSLDWSDI